MGEALSSSSSHVRVGEYEAWARRRRRCVVVVACGGREGVVGMQTRATGTGMSAGQQDLQQDRPQDSQTRYQEAVSKKTQEVHLMI